MLNYITAFSITLSVVLLLDNGVPNYLVQENIFEFM